MNGDYERVRAAILYLADNVERQPTLDEVAAHIGLSPHHFQRLFVRWAGVSPKRVLQHLTAARARELLHASRPVLDAAFELGLSGPGRLHDLMVVTEAVTPGQIRSRGAGLEIRYGFAQTPFGLCFAASTRRGLCALRFLEPGQEASILTGFSAEWDRAALVPDDSSTRSTLARVFSPESRGQNAPPLPMHLKGTNFQLKVWRALLEVPEGALISYSDLADRIGEPRATRAVASAVGANPVAYLIPCHRVLRSTGELGGYRWGLERKLVMLERELHCAS